MQYLYTISCPITNHIVYIGKTKNAPWKRFYQHKNNFNKCPVGAWCKAMISIGFEPVFTIVLTQPSVFAEEDEWIDKYRAIGMADFNRTITRNGLNTSPYRKFFGKRVWGIPTNYYRTLFYVQS